jgi:small subunit ribosomal protein S7
LRGEFDTPGEGPADNGKANMAFKKFTHSEEILKPDPRFNSKLLSKFINCLMWEGKKSVAQKIVYDALDAVSKKLKDVPSVELFETALNNVKPFVEVRSRRVGGANYQVPMQVSKKRQQSLAIRWILDACRSGGGRSMSSRLADELLAAFKKEGKAMTTRENTHRMAEANKAFAHFAW